MRVAIPLFFLLGCVPDFSGLRLVQGSDAGASDAGLDAGVNDAGVEADAGPPDAGPPDAGPPEPTNGDVQCSETWEDLRGPTGSCAGRRVIRIARPADVARNVALTLTDIDLVFAWSVSETFDTGSLELMRFDPTRFLTLDEDTIEPGALLGEMAGRQVSLSSSGSMAHVVYTSGEDQDNTLFHRRWNGDALETPTVVGTGLANQAAIDVAGAGSGEAHIVWQHAEDRTTWHRLWRTDGTLSTPAVLGNDSSAEPPARAVSVSMRGSVAYAAWLDWDGLNGTTPSIARVGASERPIIAEAPLTISGMGLDLDVGLLENSVFLEWAGGVGTVQVVQSDGVNPPRITAVGDREALEEMPSHYPIAIAEDHLGLLHVVRYDQGTTTSVLEYHRQTLPGGVWVEDTISTSLSNGIGDVFVDLVVGPDRRPHIIYISRGDVQYATITP